MQILPLFFHNFLYFFLSYQSLVQYAKESRKEKYHIEERAKRTSSNQLSKLSDCRHGRNKVNDIAYYGENRAGNEEGREALPNCSFLSFFSLSSLKWSRAKMA